MKVEQECFKTLSDFAMNPSFRKGNGRAGVYIWGFSLEERGPRLGPGESPTITALSKKGNFFHCVCDIIKGNRGMQG